MRFSRAAYGGVVPAESLTISGRELDTFLFRDRYSSNRRRDTHEIQSSPRSPASWLQLPLPQPPWRPSPRWLIPPESIFPSASRWRAKILPAGEYRVQSMDLGNLVNFKSADSKQYFTWIASPPTRTAEMRYCVLRTTANAYPSIRADRSAGNRRLVKKAGRPKTSRRPTCADSSFPRALRPPNVRITPRRAISWKDHPPFFFKRAIVRLRLESTRLALPIAIIAAVAKPLRDSQQSRNPPKGMQPSATITANQPLFVFAPVAETRRDRHQQHSRQYPRPKNRTTPLQQLMRAAIESGCNGFRLSRACRHRCSYPCATRSITYVMTPVTET